MIARPAILDPFQYAMQPVQRISWAVYHRQPNNGVSDTAHDRLFNCDFVVARAQPGKTIIRRDFFQRR